MEPMNPDEARTIVNRYRCSDCWGLLQDVFGWRTNTSTIRCTTPGCGCHGVVSSAWVEKQQSKSIGELMDAREALSHAVPWIQLAKPKRGQEQILKELGF